MALVMMEQSRTCFWKRMLHQQQKKGHFLDNVWPVVTDAISDSDLMPPSIRSSLFSASPLINMVVMATHSYVISCHINTYISGTHYKACNSGAPVDSWQFVIGCTENGTCISINPWNARKRPQGLFYYLCTESFVNFCHFLFVVID